MKSAVVSGLGMWGDPIGQGLIDRLFKRGGVALTATLFQLYAVDVDQQYTEAEEIKSALSGAGGSWGFAEGLFIGAAEFGRAFFGLVTRYRKSAKAYVQACEALQSGNLENFTEDPENPEDSSQSKPASGDTNVDKLLEDALEFFEWAHPETSGGEEPLTTGQKMKMLGRSCRRNKRFVRTYNNNHYEYTKRIISQMVRVLQYYFKYFKSYIADILSIFYESAIAMLETKLNETGAIEGSNSPADEMLASEARQAARRNAAQSATDESQLPRKLFRVPKFAQEATRLANGLYSAGASHCA